MLDNKLDSHDQGRGYATSLLQNLDPGRGSATSLLQNLGLDHGSPSCRNRNITDLCVVMAWEQPIRGRLLRGVQPG